jgi:hypothetical protein
MPEVQADFDLTLNILTPEGDLIEAAVFSKKQVVPIYMARNIRVPHLHQKDPSGKWLATWNATAQSIEVRAVAELGKVVRRIPLLSLLGDVEHFRWLGDGSGWVVATPYSAWVVSKDEYAGVRIRKIRVKGLTHFSDIRVTGAHILIATNNYRPELFLVDSKDLSARQIKVAGASILSATVTGKGHIVAAIRPDNAYRSKAPDEIVFWSPNDDLQIVDRRTCPRRHCAVYNWTPGTQQLVYALDNNTIVLEDEQGNTTLVKLDGSLGEKRINILWQNPKEDKVLAANDKHLAVWTLRGELRWKWASPANQAIRSAHFDSDDSVIVTTGTQVLRLEQGVVVEQLVDLGKGRVLRAEGIMLEDAFPLHGGAVAFSTVKLHKQRNVHSRRGHYRSMKRIVRRVRRKSQKR